MIGHKIRDYMTQNDIALETITDNTSISAGELTEMLSGARPIQVIEYMEICTALQVNIITFIY